MLALRAPGQGPPSYSPNRILIDLQKAVYDSSQFSQITIKQSHLLETCHYWRPYPRALEMSCQPDTHFINHLDRQFRGLVACITRRSPCKRQLLHFWCLSPEFAKLIYLTILSKLWCCADTTIVLFFFFFLNSIGLALFIINGDTKVHGHTLTCLRVPSTLAIINYIWRASRYTEERYGLECQSTKCSV